MTPKKTLSVAPNVLNLTVSLNFQCSKKKNNEYLHVQTKISILFAKHPFSMLLNRKFFLIKQAYSPSEAFLLQTKNVVPKDNSHQRQRMQPLHILLKIIRAFIPGLLQQASH